MKKIICLFCVLALLAALLPAACAEEPVRLGVMTGPTGIGMVKLFRDSGDVYSYTVVGSADELTPLFLQGELDIACVPANLAANLYNKTEGGVRALAVNVLGVLYITALNVDGLDTVADLKGKTIYASGKGSTPEYFLRYVLTQNGLDPDRDVTMEWKTEAGEIVALLNQSQSGIAMLPQPYASVAQAKLGENFRIALSLSDEWAALNNGTLCTTAVVMVRTEFVEKHPEAVQAFLADFAVSAQWVNENVADATALCGEFGILTAPAPVVESAIPKCNIVCITGNEMKDALSGCLGVIFEQNPKAVGGAMPLDDFYYGAQ